MFDLIDRLVSLDFGQRGMGRLYEPARARAGEPLCLAAARPLSTLAPGERVVFLTGSIVRGWVSPEIAETDGPIGVAALSRALNLGFNAIPVVLTDPPLVKCVARTLEAAGLSIVSLERARAAAANQRFTGVAVVTTCSTEHASARADAAAFLDEATPKAIVAVERSGMTADGTFRNSVGQDTSAGRALLDHVVSEGAARGVISIGIGDLGNEIGMGAIRDAVVRHVANGELLCAAQATDVLLVCGVSNWGCYAIQAALAILTGRIEFAHTPRMERRLLDAAAAIGLVDGLYGTRGPNVDGLPAEVHDAVVQLLATTARRAIQFQDLPGVAGPIHDIERLARYRKLMREA
ncbi:MAG: DUF4392 domain-containing protein [Burkholderiales bacterium]|nr:DUF4392 domain-containing protein [Burkholderiales bacterium]